MFAVDQFLIMFPEFAGTPEPMIATWETQAYQQIDAIRLGANLDYAAMLWTAHNVYLCKRAALSAGTGGVNFGGALTVTSGKTVGSVSQTYDTQAAAIPGAGEYNATSYGQQYYRLVQGASLGGFHVPGRGYSAPGFSGSLAGVVSGGARIWPWTQ